jgi:iturin family lipopeptide synthetase A
VKEKVLDAFENQDYPFEELVEKTLPNRDWSRNPLFDAAFVLQNMEAQVPDIAPGELTGVDVKSYGHRRKVSLFDINLFCREEIDKLQFAVEYSTQIFKKETIERFCLYFKQIVAAVIDKVDIKLKDITISHQLLRAEENNPAMELHF